MSAASPAEPAPSPGSPAAPAPSPGSPADPAPSPARSAEPATSARPLARIRGVITDWGGVLTSPILDTVNAWIDADRIDRDSYAAVMRQWFTQAYAGGGSSPIHALERGECTNEEFERLLAAHLTHVDGRPVTADGLLARMFAASVLNMAMLDLIRSLRQNGLRTALLSNSWGAGDYPRHLFPDLFDVVVISAEVGMRKPEERIFRHTAELLGLEPQECVFVDDIKANVAAAEAIGLVGVHHSEPGPTTERLAALLALPPP
jgi:putative hydrolase of the HAD superfamily